jgi:uncharacterized protein (TIGR02594 family)
MPESEQPGDPSWLRIALGELGTAEDLDLGESNPQVLKYLQSTTLGHDDSHNDQTDWCSAFVNWCIEQSHHEGTNSAAARSWVNWGKPTNDPVRGCVVVFSRGPGHGHVGFYLRRRPGMITVLGGNQGHKVTIADQDDSRLLGYRLGPEEDDVTKEELRDMLRAALSPGFDSVSKWAEQLNQVRRDVEVIRRDVEEIKSKQH